MPPTPSIAIPDFIRAMPSISLRTLIAMIVTIIASPAYGGDYALRIIHTNDFHARFEPINQYDGACSAEDNAAGECFGGAARLANTIGQAKSASENYLLVDGGDQFQGSLFYTHYKGAVAAEFMNEFGYDAMTVGNHEFDDGPAVLATFIDRIDFPILMSNGDVAKEPSLAGKVDAFIVLERDNRQIGLIGLTPADTNELSSPGSNIIFGDPVPAVRASVAELEAKGVDIVIVLSHSGYNTDRLVAEQVPEIDVVVGGHSNTLLSNTLSDAAGPYPTMVGTTAIVQAYAYGKYLGVLDLVFDDDGVISSAEGEPVLIDSATAEDQKIVARIQELAKPLDKIREQVVGAAGDTIEGNGDVCRVQECAMGNLIADAMLDRVRAQDVSIAIQNSGGIRASIDEGDITMGEVLTVLPFQNTLSTFRLMGHQVVAALENGVSQVEEKKGRFPQIAGLRLTWDPTAPPNGGRVTDVKVSVDGDWVAIDPEAIYGVVTNNYVRTGGDGYQVFANDAIDAYDFGPNLEDVVADYVGSRGEYQPYVDGRISTR